MKWQHQEKMIMNEIGLWVSMKEIAGCPTSAATAPPFVQSGESNSSLHAEKISGFKPTLIGCQVDFQ